jgi:hypothetical protein
MVGEASVTKTDEATMALKEGMLVDAGKMVAEAASTSPRMGD